MKNIFKKAEFILIFLLFCLSIFIDNLFTLLMLLINNPIFDYFLAWITHVGSVFIVLLFMTTLFMWAENKRKWIPLLWLGAFLSGVFSYLIKAIVQRPRLVIPGLLAGSSFPSAHAAIAFATVPILDKEFPKLKWFWIGFAILVGVSRVYFQYHYLSDVFAGPLLDIQ